MMKNGCFSNARSLSDNRPFPVEPDQEWKIPDPLMKNYCSNFCRDIQISDLRRMSILRKPLLIGDKIE